MLFRSEKIELVPNSPARIVHGSDGVKYECLAVVVATGASARELGCKGEKEHWGKGVSYCATCDGAFFEECEIVVIGGGDSAVEEAMYLTKFARNVTIIHRRDELRAAKSIQEKAFKIENLHFMWDSAVTNWWLVAPSSSRPVTSLSISGAFAFEGRYPARPPIVRTSS